MDRALLERMVGAVVLLLLLVVVAPALLDGPEDSGGAPEPAATSADKRVETIVLDVAPGSEPAAIADAMPAPASELVPEASPAREPTPVPKPAAAPAPKPAPEAAPKPRPAPVPAPKPDPEPRVAAVPEPAETGFIVQLGSFSSRENAQSFYDKIKARGFSVKLAELNTAAGKRYRVYVGPRPTREAAEELVAVMANSGYEGMIKTLDREGG